MLDVVLFFAGEHEPTENESCKDKRVRDKRWKAISELAGLKTKEKILEGRIFWRLKIQMCVSMSSRFGNTCKINVKTSKHKPSTIQINFNWKSQWKTVECVCLYLWAQIWIYHTLQTPFAHSEYFLAIYSYFFWHSCNRLDALAYGLWWN